MSEALRELGQETATHLDAQGPRLDEHEGLARFRRVVDAGVVKPRRPRARLIAAMAAVVAVVAFMLWPRRPLDFVLEGGRPAAVTAWIEGEAATEARFSDGSLVQGAAGSRWRVQATTPRGATLQLERGALTAHVTHRDDTEWRVDAGPYAIRVTGTGFTTHWDPVTQTFELAMHDGTVVLSGPVVGGQREVTAPEHLRVQLEDRRLSVVSPESGHGPERDDGRAMDDETAAESEVDGKIDGETDGDPEIERASEVPVDFSREAAWRAHAVARRYPEALAAIRARGASSLVASASPADLLLIAQVARLGGDADVAHDALDALRTRHPRSVQARTAQFLEARMQYDRGQHAAAADSLAAYLAAGGGAFSGQAEVLLILALHRAGRSDEARRRARAYLQRHPEGAPPDRIRGMLGL